ncbi:MAG: polysaccharide biosynthesis/export family protein [Acidobacteriales bacterium]|nr:polysaccharide biosynthesis/export family protein [Terriglobales bacterium]
MFPAFHKVAALALFGYGVSVCFGQTPVAPTAQQPAAQAPASDGVSAPDAQIGPGDLIDVRVFGVPEMAATTRVNSNGDITFPLIGSTHVGGMTVGQAQSSIEQRLVSGGYLRHPQVTILIREFTTQGVSVLGEVQHPGFFPMVHSERLMDAISAAGGLSQRAGKVVIITHRDQTQPMTVNLAFNADALQQQSNIQLRPGDTVNVGRAGIVYVTGDVNRPGGFVLDNSDSVTVLQALALAQGAKATASLNKARLIRRTAAGPQEIDVPLKEIASTKKPDVGMLPDDILFVPNSAGKSAGRKSLESIVQIATGVLIYRP